jgi:hypothetical protein
VLEIPQGLSGRAAQRPVHVAANLFSRRLQAGDHRRRSVLDRADGCLRNYTVHTYNEQLADYVYSRLAEAAHRFRAVLAATTIEPD